MGSFSITMSLLLFLAFQLPDQTGANPVSNADLMDFKVGLMVGVEHRQGQGTFWYKASSPFSLSQ